jgi:hypothetical protein
LCLRAIVGPKNTQKSLKRPSWAYFWLFLPTFGVFRNFVLFRTFLVILLLNKASDERVGGVPLF